MKAIPCIRILAVTVLVFGFAVPNAFAQLRRLADPVIIEPGALRRVRVFGALDVAAGRASSEDGEAQEVAGAVLKTDPDLEALLDKANRHASEGNFRVATRLWQAVLERSGDSLYSEDEINYYSISDQVEQILAQLPAEALDIYRVTADASAKQILAEADDPNDIAALMRVAGNFFVSSEGDDAAFRLGCLYLDRHDFSGALRVFRKIASQHPDPSVSLDEVHARIAICHAFMGNPDLARDSLSAGRGYGADSAAIDAVERSIVSIAPTDTRDAALSQWKTSHGNSKRLAAMPSLPDSSFTVDQVAKWQFFVPPRDDRYISRPETIGKVLAGEKSHGEYAASTRNPVEKKMVAEWAEKGWRPAGHLLFDENQIYFKAPADVIAFDRKKIADLIASSPDPLQDKSSEPRSTGFDIEDFASWRSVWRNVFEVDPATTRKQQLSGARQRINIRRTGRQVNSATKLALFPKTMHFDDLIHQQMSMLDGVVYTIEGKSFNDRSRHAAARQVNHGWNVNFRRTRTNFLTAYESESGRMLWRLPRVNIPESPSYDPTKKPEDIDETDRWLRSGGMMAAPVKFADLLIVPVNQNGAIHLYGIDPANEGQTVWSAFLCDEPETGSVATSPINLTIDGSDLFVTCGTGVLFVVDPTTGKIRFAKRYTRSGETNDLLRRSFNSIMTDFDGWSSDVILPNGRELICLCSDTDEIVAIDRNNGSMVWKTSLRPYGAKVDYIIGAWGDLLYLGGKQTIIAIDLKAEGYVAWGGEPMFDGSNSTGRGMVTPQGVFVPVGNAIWRFGLKAKKGRAEVLNQVEAFLGTEAPVGNLYSDGERIWVHGASRLYALSPKEE
ncbi:outer membrane protein assembly factor BamB family protein [Mariniblastus fucicola]|uniref:PQQ enzyme repeat protein n=1 Tax=Mariniblastus fucicola TaxID=980251 RepID=A0A5B9P2R8_9BACT|nr:PQQ-binding-like beta-propeller repeat protein [Mariniblastus fucicola]QEG20827.1 PQQ enzyme repeat protein [Mariniblastus fucicola]